MESNSKLIIDKNPTSNKSSQNNQSSNLKESGFSRSCIWLEGDYNQLMSGLPENLKLDPSSTFRRTDNLSKKLSIKQSQTPGLRVLQKQRTSNCSTQGSVSSNHRKPGRVQTLASNFGAGQSRSGVNENIFETPSSVFNNSSFEAEKTETIKKDEVFDTEAPDLEDDRSEFAFGNLEDSSEVTENKEKLQNDLSSSLISDSELREGLENDLCQMKMESCISRVNERKSQVFIKLSKVIQELNSDIRKDKKVQRMNEEFRRDENDEWTIIEGELEQRESLRSSSANSACCTGCYIF